jgi:two-component system OmpR family response regulator
MARGPTRLSVLVVDDNRDGADALGLLLGLMGCGVRVAYGGEAGIRTALADPPDCAFLDIDMPQVDGYAVARRLRDEPATRGIKLVAFTANSGEPHASRIRAAGFDRHLVKGGSPEDLEGVLRMMEQIKSLAASTEQIAKRSVELAGQAGDLLRDAAEELRDVKAEFRDVKADLKEVKGDLKEVKQELKGVKDALAETRVPADDPPLK